MGHRKLNGTKVHTEFSTLPIRRGLLKTFGLDQPTPRAQPKMKKVGRPPQRPSDPITDEVLARMRGDHELRGVCQAVIATAYGITPERCRQLLGYVNRTHIKAV